MLSLCHMNDSSVSQFLGGLPDVFLELNGAGQVVRHVGGGREDTLLDPAGSVGQNIAAGWPAGAAQRLRHTIRKALRSRQHQVCTVELGEQGTAAYEVRLFVRGRDRLLAVLRLHAPDDPRSQSRSFTDTLTGLATRDRLLLELENALSEARLRERRIGLLCLDIDRLTRINETFGRQTGDEVLKIAALRINSCLRERDQLVELDSSAALARVGGDEFIMVLNIQSREAMSRIAERLSRIFADPLHCNGHDLAVSPSIGMAIFPEDGNDAESLLTSARAALDTARDFGTANGFFHSTAADRSMQAQDLSRELRWALENNQLELHYLPRIELSTRQITAVEALLRWRHPVRGFVPLPQVIPLAETTGLMRPIGEWTLAAASTMARRLGEAFDHPPTVSINLSQREFSRPDLPDLVSTTLAKTGIDGSRLQLEFTESALMRHRQSQALLERLSALDVRLAIDDFGTGHISMVQLQSLPVSALKIDHSLVTGIDSDPERLSLCSAIISVGRHLQLEVIAEGVETQNQLQLLEEAGCQAAQGFYFTRPLPADALFPFLHSFAGLKHAAMITG